MTRNNLGIVPSFKGNAGNLLLNDASKVATGTHIYMAVWVQSETSVNLTIFKRK